MPVLAALVPAVLLVVGLHVPLGRPVDGLEDSWPGVTDADVARSTAPRRHLLSFLVVDHGVDADNPWATAPGLHRLEGGQRAAQKAAHLCLPPRVDDHGVALPNDVVVPTPYVRLDRLSDCGHVLEAVVVLLGFIGAELPQHANRRGGGVEDVDPEAFGDPPGPAGVRVSGDALVHDAGGPQRQRPVDDVGVAGDPADVREAPVSVLGMDVLVVL